MFIKPISFTIEQQAIDIYNLLLVFIAGNINPSPCAFIKIFNDLLNHV